MNSKMIRAAVGLATAAGLAFAPGIASASLSIRAAYQNAALSIDGVVSSGDVRTVQVDTPAGATILAAYLYVSDIWGSGSGDVSLNGNTLAQADGTLLTPNVNPANTRVFNVSSFMTSAITGGLQNFNYSEANASYDGAALVVVYRTASTNGTAIIMDGELSTGGDSTVLNFAAPYTGGDAIMSLASSFSYNGNSTSDSTGQVTTIDVTTSSTASRRLTGCAGGNDDAGFISANGQLFTVGGIGDSAANPDPACAGGAGDDELYNLAAGNSASATPFLQNGDTSITLTTRNPSNDDNVFFLAFSSAFQVTRVDDEEIPNEPPTDVPEPGTLALLGLGMGLLGLSRRRKSA